MPQMKLTGKLKVNDKALHFNKLPMSILYEQAPSKFPMFISLFRTRNKIPVDQMMPFLVFCAICCIICLSIRTTYFVVFLFRQYEMWKTSELDAWIM